MNKLKLSREKIDIQLGNNLMSITALANAYGCSRARINVILNSREDDANVCRQTCQGIKCQSRTDY